MNMLSILTLLKIGENKMFLIILPILFLIDLISIYGFLQLFKSKLKNYKIPTGIVLWSISIASYSILAWMFFFHYWPVIPVEFAKIFTITGILYSIYFPKLIFISFILIFFFVAGCQKLLGNKTKQRPEYIIILGSIIYACVVISMLWGIKYGRFKLQVIRTEINAPDLPKSFNNLKIVQISDLHLGTVPNNKEFIEKVVKTINLEKPDLIFITGDIVNSFSSEIREFIPTFKKLQAKNGIYAVLGNHDYGDYYIWKNVSDQLADQRKLRSYFPEMGIKLMQNENVFVKKLNDTIFIAGIENWGEKPYRQEGDLNEALDKIDSNKFVMLLSHDPSFWDLEVLRHKNIKITFSGHLHGFQLGLKFGDFEWSPFKYLLKHVSGLYENQGQFIYINRGLGAALYPGRVGVYPEISVITLKSLKK